MAEIDKKIGFDCRSQYQLKSRSGHKKQGFNEHMKTKARQKHRGNALMEYVVPMTAILITAGVLATVFDIQDILAEYFAAASGHTGKPSGTFRTDPMGSTINGAMGSGSGGFSNFGRITDGDG
jgi:hypothetical protein